MRPKPHKTLQNPNKMSNTTTSPAVNLFNTLKAKEPGTKKTDKKVINAPQLEDKVRRFSELKAQIDEATAQLKMIEGDIKAEGRLQFLSEYLRESKTPDNFKLMDKTGASCLFIVMDKYTSVDETKAEILRQYNGLLTETRTYKFNPDLVDKYGAILSDLIVNCPNIAGEDKGQLISGEIAYSVTKGSIDKLLLQSATPSEIFELINPIVSLKK
jgi:hypothetical protein